MYRSLSLSISFGEIESKRTSYQCRASPRTACLRFAAQSNTLAHEFQPKNQPVEGEAFKNREESFWRDGKGYRRHQDRFSRLEISQASLFPLDPLFGNQIRHGASIRAGVNDGLVPRVLPAAVGPGSNGMHERSSRREWPYLSFADDDVLRQTCINQDSCTREPVRIIENHQRSSNWHRAAHSEARVGCR